MSNETVFPRFAFVTADGVDPNLPGIYQWEVEGVGIYIGKYKRVSRPMRAYARNVANLLAERAYRKNNHEGFRTVHTERPSASSAT